MPRLAAGNMLYLPICMVFDHRALDFGDITPLIKAMDSIFQKPAVIHSL